MQWPDGFHKLFLWNTDCMEVELTQMDLTVTTEIWSRWALGPDKREDAEITSDPFSCESPTEKVQRWHHVSTCVLNIC